MAVKGSSGAIELFRLFGSIFLQGGEETKKDLDQIDKKAGGIGGTFGKVAKGVGIAGAAIAGAATVIGGAVMGVATKASVSASRINDLSQKIGISKTAFQEWDYVTKMTGTSVEVLQMGVKTLSNAALEASMGTESYANAFKELGVEVTNADGSLKDQEVLLNEVVTALAGVEDKTKRTALASDLLGRSATELAPILNMEAGEVDGLKKKAHDLGIVLSDEVVEAGDEFGDTLDTLKATFGSLMTQAIGPFLPILNDLMKQFIVILPPLMDFIRPLIEKLMPVVQTLISKLLPVFLKLLDALMPILDPLIDIFVLLLDAGLVPLIEILAEAITMILPPFIDLLKALMPVIKPLIEITVALLSIFTKLFVNSFKMVLDVILPAFTDAMKGVGDAIGGIADFILKAIPNAFEAAKKFGASIFEGIMNFITSIPDKIEKVWNDITNFVGGIFGGGKKTTKTAPAVVPTYTDTMFGFAEGTDYVPRSGKYKVGEYGPEEVFLPQGAAVKPADKGVTININYPKLFNQKDAKELANLIYDRWSLAGVGKAR